MPQEAFRRPTLAQPMVPAIAPPIPRMGFPFFVFCLYTFILIGRPQDYLPALAPLRLVITFTIITCIVTFMKSNSGIPNPFRLTETRLYVFFFLVMCAGIPFSIYRWKSFEFVVLGYIGNLVFFVLMLVHVNSLTAYRRLAYVITISALIFSLVGLSDGQFQDGRFVTSSDMFDPNDMAFVELSLLPFALFILFGSSARLGKLLAFVTAGLAVLLTVYSGSRGGFLGLGIFLLMFLLVRVPGVKRFHKIALLILCIGGVAANLDNPAMERYRTLTEVRDDYNLSDEFGRSKIWERGFQIFLENPLTGVGVSGFSEAIGTMRAEDGTAPRWQAAHNSYVQVLTETGLFGGLAFLSMILVCLKVLSGRALTTLKAPVGPERDLALLARLLLVGFVTLLFTAAFLSQAYSVLFTLFFGAAAALRQIASSVEPAPERARTGVTRVSVQHAH